MNGRRSDRRVHAARVATVATLVTALTYVAVMAVLNVVVAHRLVGAVDARLTDRLTDLGTLQVGGAAPAGGAASAPRDSRDFDEAPIFVWNVTTAGATTSSTASAPALPRRTWSAGPASFELAGLPFRFRAEPSPAGWTVVGVSASQVGRVRSALLLPEILVGALLMVMVYGGALLVGLRASAPLALVSKRQAEFTADASHELRTPLSVIEAEVSLALSRPREPAAYRETLERVAAEGHRLQRIVDDLLWLARADADDRAPGSFGPVDLGAVAGACVDRFGAVAAARGVTIRLEPPPGDPVIVRATPEMIDRLTGVLVDNACRHAGETGGAGGGAGTVLVRVGGTGVRAFLTVEDSGPGIPPEERPRVLDRFHRATDEPGGTGLGLAIADSVVRATHGTWSIGQAAAGGARMEVAWRRAIGTPGRDAPRQGREGPGRPGPATDAAGSSPRARGDSATLT